MKNRLEELRRERGITQEELAAILEVSRQTISSLEKGRYNPSILLAFKIARCFGQTTCGLMAIPFLKEKPCSPNGDGRAGCSFWRGCSCWPGPGCC